MIFVYGILPLVLLAESFKLCQANLFGKKSIELTGTLENDRDVIVNTEIWNLAEGQIKSILVTREDPYDLGIDTPCKCFLLTCTYHVSHKLTTSYAAFVL